MTPDGPTALTAVSVPVPVGDMPARHDGVRTALETTATATGWTVDRLARAALTAVCEPGSMAVARVVAEFGPVDVWCQLARPRKDSETGTAASRRAEGLELSELVERSAHAGVRFVAPGDAEWPLPLETLETVDQDGMGGLPFGLWARGSLEVASACAESVAVVGSRAASGYGTETATGLAYDLASGDDGYSILSGGAYGIDAAAHRGALAARGVTVAVMAGGLDDLYPRGNQVLLRELASEHLVLSEVPVGRRPTRAAFLARNRLIAALTLGTVIVEAAPRSGARNTVTWAGRCGRPVMAVPGPVHSLLSVTPHRLIRDSEAVLVADHDDVRAVLEPLGSGRVLPAGGNARFLDDVPPELLRVREALPGRGAASVGEVALASGSPVPTCLAALAQLEDRGLVEPLADGRWRLRRP